MYAWSSRSSVSLALNTEGDCDFIRTLVDKASDVTNRTWSSFEAPVITKYPKGAVFRVCLAQRRIADEGERMVRCGVSTRRHGRRVPQYLPRGRGDEVRSIGVRGSTERGECVDLLSGACRDAGGGREDGASVSARRG